MGRKGDDEKSQREAFASADLVGSESAMASAPCLARKQDSQGVVGYKDHCSGAFRFQMLEFDSQTATPTEDDGKGTCEVANIIAEGIACTEEGGTEGAVSALAHQSNQSDDYSLKARVRACIDGRRCEPDW